MTDRFVNTSISLPVVLKGFIFSNMTADFAIFAHLGSKLMATVRYPSFVYFTFASQKEEMYSNAYKLGLQLLYMYNTNLPILKLFIL